MEEIMKRKMVIVASLIAVAIVVIILVCMYYQSMTHIENNIKTDVELIENLKVGDYVNYGELIDNNVYLAEKDRTGWEKDKELETEKKDWRVLRIDEETGEVLITTEGVVNDGFYLKGSKGYINGIEELESICKKLYSSSYLELEARSMNVDDLNFICNYSPEYEKRYAFYPYSSSISSSSGTNIEYNGNSYIKLRHYMGPNENGIFYDCDGGGIECIDEDGYKYVASSENTPVYITKTSYNYDVSGKNKIAGEILGEDFGWLASKCIGISTNYSEFYVEYGIRGVNKESVVDGDLFASRERERGIYAGIRPIVSLDSKIIIDNSNNNTDGSCSERAWKLINKDKIANENNQASNDELSLNQDSNSGVAELTDKLKIGDYINYSELIDSSTYATDKEKTGYEENKNLKTEKKNWRVLSIDENTGEVLITTNGTVNNEIYLVGATGYFKGAEELHRICEKLYSSTKLDLKARSMQIEDLNKPCGYSLPELERFAIYPSGMEVSGTEIYNGKEYKKVTASKFGNYVAKYLKDAIDGGGKNEGMTEDGYKYVETSEDKPIYITKTLFL